MPTFLFTESSYVSLSETLCYILIRLLHLSSMLLTHFIYLVYDFIDGYVTNRLLLASDFNFRHLTPSVTEDNLT